MRKQNVLILADYYFPSVRAGGPVASLSNLVASLGDDFNFTVLTRSHDFDSAEIFDHIQVDAINSVGNAQVIYLSELGVFSLIKWLRHLNYDLIYLNSFFSLFFSIQVLIWRVLRLIPSVPVIIVPRGELSLGALQFKRFKKWLFVRCARLFHLYRGVVWQVSSDQEKREVLDVIGESAKVSVVPNAVFFPNQDLPSTKKVSGKLRLVYLSRITRKKNLLFALHTLRSLQGEIVFDLYGPLEDAAYWQECQSEINRLPKNIEVNHRGLISHAEVYKTLSQYHLFYLPTFGENFGHVIFEALASGCPVLISTLTPWRNLAEAGIGCDCDLKDEKCYVSALQKVVDADQEGWDLLSNASREYAKRYVSNSSSILKQKNLFHELAGEVK